MVRVHEHETHVDFINLNANTENCSEMTKGMFSCSQNSNVPKAIEALSDQLFKMIACGSEFSAVITGKYSHLMYGSFL